MLSLCGCKPDKCRVWAFPPGCSLNADASAVFSLVMVTDFTLCCVLARQSSARTFWIDISALFSTCWFWVLGCRFSFMLIFLEPVFSSFWSLKLTEVESLFYMLVGLFSLLYSALKQKLKCYPFFCPCMLHDPRCFHNLLGILSVRWNCFHSSLFYLSVSFPQCTAACFYWCFVLPACNSVLCFPLLQDYFKRYIWRNVSKW